MNTRQARHARQFALKHIDWVRWATSTPGASYVHRVTTPHGLERTRTWAGPECSWNPIGEFMVDDS